MKYQIDMPDGWEPGNCEVCPCECFAEGPTDCSLIKAVPVEVEPLAVLADSKGYEAVNIIPPTGVVKEWDIELLRGYEDGDGVELEKTITAPTYPAAESAARKFLEGLPDRPTTKENK